MQPCVCLLMKKYRRMIANGYWNLFLRASICQWFQGPRRIQSTFPLVPLHPFSCNNYLGQPESIRNRSFFYGQHHPAVLIRVDWFGQDSFCAPNNPSQENARKKTDVCTSGVCNQMAPVLVVNPFASRREVQRRSSLVRLQDCRMRIQGRWWAYYQFMPGMANCKARMLMHLGTTVTVAVT